MLKIESHLDRNFATDSKIDEHLAKEDKALETLQRYLPIPKRVSSLNVQKIAHLLKQAGAKDVCESSIGYSRYVRGTIDGTQIAYYEEWGLNDQAFELEIKEVEKV